MFIVNPGHGNPFARLALPLFAAAAGAAALGAVALYRSLTRTRTAAVVRSNAAQPVRLTTVVVESDGPVWEGAQDVPW